MLVDVLFPYQVLIKLAAILWSSFDQIIFVSNNTISVNNPDDIFDSKALLETAAILWPDC